MSCLQNNFKRVKLFIFVYSFCLIICDIFPIQKTKIAICFFGTGVTYTLCSDTSIKNLKMSSSINFWATSKTWTWTLDPYPGPWTQTLYPGTGPWTRALEPGPGPWTLDPDPGSRPWIQTLKNLDPEEPGP